MPYVKQDSKDRIDLPYVSNLGELTYVIDRIGEDLVWKLANYDFSKLKFDQLAAVHGAMVIAEREFYRRVIAPFEDGKMLVNGDIFVYPHPEQWVDAIDDSTVVVVPDEAGAEVA